MAEATSLFTNGQAYERLMGRWSRAAGEEFLDWLSLPKGLNWLDVGCGTGAFTELVIDRCAPSNISAIDPAEDQIAYARNGSAAKRATFRTGDAQSLPFADREFDVAAMALVISFVPDAAKAVAEMKRVVRPQGIVAAYMWDILGGGFIQRPLVQALGAMGIDVPPATGRKNSSIEEMRSLPSRGAGGEAFRAGRVGCRQDQNHHRQPSNHTGPSPVTPSDRSLLLDELPQRYRHLPAS
jgi:SAM-dependent methyltransferase